MGMALARICKWQEDSCPRGQSSVTLRLCPLGDEGGYPVHACVCVLGEGVALESLPGFFDSLTLPVTAVIRGLLFALGTRL